MDDALEIVSYIENAEPDADTVGKKDEFTLLAIRILNYAGREDLADGLDKEVGALETEIFKLKERVAELENKQYSSKHNT